MPYTPPTDESRERLLWLLHDDCMWWLKESRARTIPDSQKLDRIMLALAALALALTGGYREGGIRQ